MNAGRYDRLINIRKSVTSTARSTDGAPILTVTTVSSNIWCEVKPLSGSEFFTMNEKYYDADTQFSIRYSSLYDQQCQVVYDGKTYDIKNNINIWARNRELKILAKVIE